MMTKVKLFGYGAVIGALLIAAGVPIAYKAASSISVIELLALVSLTGTAISLLFMLATGNQKHLKGYFTNRNAFLAMLAFGILAYSFVSFTLSYATHYVSANLAAVIYRTWPLMIIALAPFIIREKITRYDALAVVIGFSGLAIVLLQGTSISMPLYELPFVILLLFGALADAIASAVQKRYTYEIYSSLFMYNLIALIIFMPIAIAYNSINLFAIPRGALVGILFLGLLQNVALTFFFAKAMRSIKTSIVGNALLSVPFLTMILSAVILKEKLVLYYFVIAITTVIGIAVQRLSKNTSNYVTKTSKSKGHAPMIYDVSSAFVNTRSNVIYDALKGEGRALAIYEDIKDNETKIQRALANELAKHNKMLIFTDKMHIEGVGEDEIDFIKDLMKYRGSGLLVVGIGKPRDVEEALYRIHNSS